MIIQHPNEVLNKVATDVNLDDTNEVQSVVEALLEEWEKLPNTKAGLAAPQIGLSKRAFIMYGKVILNPTFKPAEQLAIGKEGCFSVDNAKEFFDVWRHKYGWATYYDCLTLKLHTEKIGGMAAKVFQHELDHLNGKLCIATK